MSLSVLCPTRGRRDACAATYDSFLTTRECRDTQFWFIASDDEPLDYYRDLPVIFVPAKRWMNEVLQAGVDIVLEKINPDVIAFIADDNRFRTIGWDRIIEDHLRDHPGFAYANDLMRQDLPTHVFVSTKIIRRLGWLGLPGSRHLFIDNTWRHLGMSAGCLYHFPNIVIEHLHPLVGKGVIDDSYMISNAPEMYEHDREMFEGWLMTTADADVQAVKEAVDA